MNDMTSTSLRSPGLSIPSREYAETRWYAAYTCANHEKRIAEQLHLRGVEFFLPLYDTVLRWKDRRMRMQFPLFPGYIFVHMPLLPHSPISPSPPLHLPLRPPLIT